MSDETKKEEILVQLEALKNKIEEGTADFEARANTVHEEIKKTIESAEAAGDRVEDVVENSIDVFTDDLKKINEDLSK